MTQDSLLDVYIDFIEFVFVIIYLHQLFQHKVYTNSN